ncbi:NYN domain-containing protein [Comamonas thiooxydans]|uniref:NYN domain-containing protein n=1 Tax=Comamonas thiooxydans TaxID=363952 RepID=A0AA42PZY1_9BURK|nr:NYN domain-containing protein [Comamonas thiooxydans]MDH1333306.1 NYN domain-containing protein [Comamonas thiooxydans]MDH1738921.1 NYN domain-containing protein [Comamonas thiooxydans]MDH1786176.1 NYN domain-containing protein [Comamonas thiooxydans]
MPNDVQPRIALLIDADNAPAEMIDEILTELSTFGLINIRRAYGNWTKAGLHGWQSKLLEYAVRPMQQFDYSKGKNATDMAMTVDAMELLYTEKPDAFGIVSSDADFTPLVMHLRAKGAAVYGFGAEQTPRAFVNACSRFLYFDALKELGDGIVSRSERREALEAEAVPRAVPAASQPSEQTLPASNGKVAGGTGAAAPACTTLRVPSHMLKEDRQLIGMLRDAVKATQDEAGWARVAAVGTHIGNKLSFDARNYGYASLTKLMAATQVFELRDEGTARVAVRDLRGHQDEVLP